MIIKYLIIGLKTLFNFLLILISFFLKKDYYLLLLLYKNVNINLIIVYIKLFFLIIYIILYILYIINKSFNVILKYNKTNVIFFFFTFYMLI